MTRRLGQILIAPLLLAAALVAAALPASADSPTTETVHYQQTDGPYPTDYPCLPPGGQLTLTYRGVLHITDFGTGVYHYSDAQRGTATFVTADGKVYEGTVTTHLALNSNKSPTQFTFTIALAFKLTAADGSSLSFASNVQDVGTATGREIFFEFNHC
jgi:hypothetical protein